MKVLTDEEVQKIEDLSNAQYRLDMEYNRKYKGIEGYEPITSFNLFAIREIVCGVGHGITGTVQAPTRKKKSS